VGNARFGDAAGLTLYQRVAMRVQGLVDGGTLRPGERIPSVRRLAAQLGVSVTTVLEAYRLLEDRGVIEARPQSGYYVRPQHRTPPLPRKTEGARSATTLDVGEMILRVVNEATQPDVVCLGAAVGSLEFFPTARLNRELARAVRAEPERSLAYDAVQGHEELRVQIARRALEAGLSLTPEDLVTTPGAQSAMYLCLRAVTEPGDTVAIETPTYYGLLEILESLHLRALEIATFPETGICLDALGEALAARRVAACALVPTFGNPLGHCMPDEKKRRLVELLARHEVPLVEDDVFGDLAFGVSRPRAAKAFDGEGNVLWCSSFSKTLSPGYRIGWAAPGRYLSAVMRLKFAAQVAAPTPPQMAVARFLEGGGFDRHLRRLRRAYRELTLRMSSAIAECFPSGTRISRPAGGQVLWIELPENVDAMRLHDAALAAGVSIAPGPIFSASRRYRSFIRINVATPWSPSVERAIATLGRLVHEALDGEVTARRA
jgi:DNA-binding transcriptional MocR family regulator